MDVPTLKGMTLVHGIPIATESAEDWERITEFQARPDDVLISTYPKAGKYLLYNEKKKFTF